MNLQFIKSSEKKKIIEKLNEQYGINQIPFLLARLGKEKIRGFSGSLSKEEVMALNRILRLESLGIYLMKQEREEIRLSFDAPTLFDVKKNIIEISDEQADNWLRGRDITVGSDLKGFVVLKNKENLIGCGRISEGGVSNFVPRERRIRSLF